MQEGTPRADNIQEVLHSELIPAESSSKHHSYLPTGFSNRSARQSLDIFMAWEVKTGMQNVKRRDDFLFLTKCISTVARSRVRISNPLFIAVVIAIPAISTPGIRLLERFHGGFFFVNSVEFIIDQSNTISHAFGSNDTFSSRIAQDNFFCVVVHFVVAEISVRMRAG